MLGAASVTTGLIGLDEFTHSDLHRLGRLIPGQNVFFRRQVLHNLQETLIPEE